MIVIEHSFSKCSGSSGRPIKVLNNLRKKKNNVEIFFVKKIIAFGD